MSPPLRTLLQSFRASTPGTFHASITQSWMQGRTTFGGCSAALCLEGAKRHLQDDALPLRSALVSFVGPAGGNVDVKTTVLRRGKAKGKGMAFVRAEMFAAESGELATSCQFAFGADRLASAFHSTMGVDDPPAALPGPDASPSLFASSAAFPPPVFTQHFEARLAQGGAPGSGAEESDNFMWVRHKGVDYPSSSSSSSSSSTTRGTDGGVPGVDDDVALLCLADMPPPAIVPRFTEAAPVSSCTWIVNFLARPAPPASSGGWFLLRSKAEGAWGGYSSQDMAIYGAENTPIAVGRQCVAIFDKAPTQSQSRL